MVDSSAWSHALRRSGDESVRRRVQDPLQQQTAAWCDMVRLELWNGVRDDAERAALSRLDKTLPRLPISDAVWDAAVSIASKARTAGVTVPATDVLIFACAKHYGAEIAHLDRHYELLERLK